MGFEALVFILGTIMTISNGFLTLNHEFHGWVSYNQDHHENCKTQTCRST